MLGLFTLGGTGMASQMQTQRSALGDQMSQVGKTIFAVDCDKKPDDKACKVK